MLSQPLLSHNYTLSNTYAMRFIDNYADGYMHTHMFLIQFLSNSTYHHTEGLIPHVGVWNLERHDVGCDFGCSHNKSTGTLDVDTE